MNNKIGSPDARKIVAFLHRRTRRAWITVKKAKGMEKQYYNMCVDKWCEAHNVAEYASRMLYNQKL